MEEVPEVQLAHDRPLRCGVDGDGVSYYDTCFFCDSV